MASDTEKQVNASLELKALRAELDRKNETILCYEGLMHSLLGALITSKPKQVEKATDEMREALLYRAS